ncbi:MAG: ATP-binding cassette domain-containing protein [Spirochaetales bacterium]|nr:ATP-binding cassette domain-containing protein [Spirochaetales bacterium]
MIEIKQLKYQIGTFDLEISLKLKTNEYFVLLGMTGSGKTLFLESLCGLRKINSGSVLINGMEISALSPWRRPVAYVPQDGALFTHMSVEKNIAFALSVQHQPKDYIESEVKTVARLLHIEPLLKRKIKGLSGGECQRVALARALISRPQILILDEPVSALDEYTRAQVCSELRNIQKNLRLTVIHVCHSFDEAQMVSDRIGIMQKGRIIQVGTLEDVMNKPAVLFVAQIMRHKNIFQGIAEQNNEGSVIRVNGLVFKGPAFDSDKNQNPLTFSILPWMIEAFDSEGEFSDRNIIEGEIIEENMGGAFVEYKLRSLIDIIFYISRMDQSRLKLGLGRRCQIRFSSSALYIFP